MGGISCEVWGGILASISIFTIWLLTFHKKFLASMAHTPKVTALGVYTDFGEALQSHFWYLLKAKIQGINIIEFQQTFSRDFAPKMSPILLQTLYRKIY